MPQQSLNYAVGRVGALNRGALQAGHLERLLAARSYEEAQRTLSDIGFTTSDGADFQAAADEHVKKACELIQSVTPDENVTSCFQLRYDIHNLKVLMKSRFLAQKPAFLSTCGTMSVEMLRHAVADHTYHQLPAILAEAMEELEKQLAMKFDPMLIDAALDKAMYREIHFRLRGTKCPTAKKYFRAKADLQNLIMLLRVKSMRQDAKFFEKLYLEGGSVPLARFTKAFDEPDKLAKLLSPYGTKVYTAALQAALDHTRLPGLEKVADDYLYQLFKPFRYEMDKLETLVSYLVRKQREATDVRLIMAGKLNGFSNEAVLERMRELNG